MSQLSFIVNAYVLHVAPLLHPNNVIPVHTILKFSHDSSLFDHIANPMGVPIFTDVTLGGHTIRDERVTDICAATWDLPSRVHLEGYDPHRSYAQTNAGELAKLRDVEEIVEGARSSYNSAILSFFAELPPKWSVVLEWYRERY